MAPQFFISRVRAKAFKNIGSEWREVELKAGLNAVVGPNGCGKSSLLSAISFAFGAPAGTFGVGTLSELQNTESSEVCEVHVELSACHASTRHLVSAALAPDGTRSLRLNKKNKTGKEIKEFLRGLGISLDSPSAVVKQAQVTRLADLNSPAELATVVADASGLGRWNQERRAAAEELARTSQAITSVQAKLRTLELSLAEDQQALAALQRLEAIDAEIEAAEREGSTARGTGLAHCEAHLVHGEASITRLQAEVAAREQQLQALEVKREEISEQAAAAEAAAADPTTAKMQQAALLEEVAILQRRLAEYTQLQRTLEKRREAARRASAQLAHISALLPAAMLGDAAVAAQALPLPKADMEACQQTLQQLEQERKLLEEALAAMPAAAPADGLEAQAAQQADLLAEKAAERDSLQAELQAGLAQLAPPCSTAGCQPLHLCFQFANAGDCAGLAPALDAITGRHLNVYVAEDLRTASDALGALGSGQRVWASDCLSPPDNRQRFRAAAAAFAPGEVTVPTDLLSFEAQYQGAVLRAFGGYVIAKDSQVASALIEQHGIPSVTLDGTVSQKGSLQGGWKPEQRGSSRMEAKLRCDTLQSSLLALEDSMRSVERSTQQLQAAMVQQQQKAAARSQAEARLRQVQEDISAARLDLQAHELSAAAGMSVAELQGRLHQLQAEVKGHMEEMEALEGEVQGCDAERLPAELEQKQSELQRVEQTLRQAQAAASQQQRRLAGLQEQGKASQIQLDAERSALDSLSRELQEAQRAQQEVSKLKGQLLAQEAAAAEPSGLPFKAEAAAARAPGQPLMPLGELSELLKESAQRQKAVARLQAERASLGASTGASLVHERARARQAAHQAHLRQLDILQKAVATLEEYIAGSNGTVVETNNSVASTILSLFSSLCAEVLPKYAFKFDLLGPDAHEGVVLKYSHSSGGQGAWDSSLEALSGGQRTLISLAFILASNIVGSSCSVLLLDEVDAALDEANQHLVGRLIQSMLSQGSAACTQVLCVSHNSALQDQCSHIVNLRPAQQQAQQAKRAKR